MIATPNAVQPTVFLDAVVIDGVKIRQMAEKMAGEPGEWLGLAKRADGHLQIVTAPGTLQRPARGDQAFSQQPGALGLPANLFPVRSQQRYKTPVLDQRSNAVRKGSEQRLILDETFLMGDFATPGIERNRDRMFRTQNRDAQTIRLGNIAVHYQVDGRG